MTLKYPTHGRYLMEIIRNVKQKTTYDGNRFIATDLFTGLSNGDTKEYLVDASDVPENKCIEVYGFDITTDGQCIVTVYGNVTLSSQGDMIDIHNANMQSSAQPSLKIYSAVMDIGEPIHQMYIASGNRGSRVMAEVFEHRLIGRDKLIISIKNVSGTNMAYGSIIVDWSELWEG